MGYCARKTTFRSASAAVALCFAACAPSLIGTVGTTTTGVPNEQVMAQSLAITPALGGASLTLGSIKWNDYYRRCTGGTNTCSGITDGVTACTGAETGGATACLHAAEHLTITTTITTCTGISLSDALGVFDWDCRLQGGVAVFYSQLKFGKGLKDLISGTSWRSNSVSLTNGSVTNTGTSSA